jgi:hypothetical protein
MTVHARVSHIVTITVVDVLGQRYTFSNLPETLTLIGGERGNSVETWLGTR